MTRKMRRREVLKAGVAICAGTAVGSVSGASQADAHSPDEQSTIVPLQEISITHAGLEPTPHPRLGVEVNAQSCMRYMRFGTPVRVERLELGRIVYGRSIPRVPTHPAHLKVSVLDRKQRRWKTIQEADLPPHPTIEGKGLSQEMGVEEMDARLARVMDEPPHLIDLVSAVWWTA